MTYIIHGATGAQGAPVLAALLASGHSATAAVRTPSTYSGPGEALSVDFAAPASVVEAYRGAEGVFVHLPIGGPEQLLKHALVIAEAAEASRPARVVVSTSGYTLDDPDSALAVLVRRLTDAGISTAVVQPRLYLENLLLPFVVGGAREDGVLGYPLREDYAVSWSSHLDVADVVVRLLLDDTVSGVVEVGALPGLLGADLAHSFSEHLGRPVRYESMDPEELGRLLTPIMGPGVAPVVATYQMHATQPHAQISAERSAQQLLGLSPRSVEQWLNDMGV